MLLKKIVVISIISFTGLLFSCKVEKPVEPVNTITVTGKGFVTIEPNQLELDFFVRNTEWNVNNAIDKNANSCRKIIEAIKSLGVDETDITTFDYKITQDNSNNYPGRYTVINTISVVIRNTEISGKVIDTAIVNGANGLTDYRYIITDKTTAIRQARTLAVQDAKDTAALYAGASGCLVDSVMDIKENDNYTVLETVGKKDNDFSPIEKGVMTVHAGVTITYSLTK